MNVITAPDNDPRRGKMSIFLAGTIDDSHSIDWQKELCERLSESKLTGGLTIFNPRRSQWNSEISSEELKVQINWELSHLEEADWIIMNILGSSKSPISLLELGLFARTGKLKVFCPEEYFRSTNVEVTCEHYHVCLIKTNDIDKIVNTIKELTILQT